MTMYRTQSANVLNEADRYERILDWQMFQMNQEQVLYWTTEDSPWQPGTPLYPHPRGDVSRCNYFWSVCIDDHCTHGTRERWWFDGAPPENYEGNCTRYLIDIVEDGDRHQTMRCKTCDVSWRDIAKRTPCWVCGEMAEGRFATPSRESSLVFHHTVSMGDLASFDVVAWMRAELSQRLSEGMDLPMDVILFDNGRTSVDGARTHFSIHDEIVMFDDFQIDYNYHSYGHFREGPITPFPYPERRFNEPFEHEVSERIVLPGVADSVPEILHPERTWERPATVVLPEMGPEELGPQARTIPLPPVPEPRVFPSFAETQHQRFTQMITETRRSR